MATTDQIFEMVRGLSDHVLDLVKRNESLAGQIKVSNESISTLKKEQEDLSVQVRQLISMMRDRMTPDRCAHMHDELGIRIKKEVFSEIKAGAKGWVRGLTTVMKIVAYASLIFGGSTVGAQALGLIKLTGG